MSGPVYTHANTKQTMNRVRAKSMPFEWSINPYRGCAHGCSFCYARAFHPFLGLGANDDFQNRILIKQNAAEALEAQLAAAVRKYGGKAAAIRNIGEIAIGTATDPYQPVEAKARITRECLKVLAKYEVPVSITTRSPLILRDLDLLEQMNIVTVNMSVNTMNPALMRLMEPASPHPMKRMEAVAALTDRGIQAGIFLAPILPFLTDSGASLESLCAAARDHRAAYVMPSLLRLAPDVKAWYESVLHQHFPQLLSRYAAIYNGAYPRREYVDRVMGRVRRILAQFALCDAPAARISPADATQEPEVEQLCFSFALS